MFPLRAERFTDLLRSPSFIHRLHIRGGLAEEGDIPRLTLAFVADDDLAGLTVVLILRVVWIEELGDFVNLPVPGRPVSRSVSSCIHSLPGTFR